MARDLFDRLWDARSVSIDHRNFWVRVRKAIVKLEQRVEKAERERDRYHDALIARHGGEPAALQREIVERLTRERDEARGTVRELLEMLALVPEHMLAGLRVDPYGTIGDALSVIGESRDPDSWRALHRMCGFPDPGPAEDGRDDMREGQGAAKCFGCGLPYGSPGFADLVVPHDVWARISPTGDEGGLLCPTCMCVAAESAGVRCQATFRSGPFAEDQAKDGGEVKE